MSKNTERHEVIVRRVRVLRGSNLYAYMPVLQITMDIGSYEERASDSFPGFAERLVNWLPGLQKHECSLGRPGGFIERLQRGTYLGHICEHVALELQIMLGYKVAFGRVRGTGERGVYNVVLEYEDEEPACQAFDVALRLTLAAMHDEPFDTAAEVEALQSVADKYRLGPSTAAIVAAARRRRIPITRLTPTGSLVQLGYGVYQKRILASETTQTSSIAVDVCQEKPLTNQILRTVGVPVPDGQSVRSADEAWEIAQEIGLPVVVKPEAGNHGRGVSTNLNSEAEVKTAYRIARDFDSQVLVEHYVVGDDYRLLVVNGKLVAAARREPAQVVGDGKHTIQQLIDILNQDPRRRPGHSSILTRIEADEAVNLVLSQQSLALESIPAPEQVVRLRNNSNLSTGGTSTDVTDEIHPHNVQIAEMAAQILGLDVAGIDVVCRAIQRPLEEQNGAIVEVNAAPGLRMHLYPSQGLPRDVAAPIVEMLYPGDAPARIPIIAVTGTNGKTTVTRLISHMFETAHWVVGMTSTQGAYIGQARIFKGDCAGPRSARAILLHPYVEVAVLETARGGILREGLGFDSCDVAVVTNISADHLGLDGIETLEELAQVKQVVVEGVHRQGQAVLNADDPLVAEMAAATYGEVIYFCMDKDNPTIQAHLHEGGRCVFVEDNAIVLATGESRFELVTLDRIPFTLQGKIRFQVQNALASVAAAWANDLNPALIVRALTTFKSDFNAVPGRFNLTEINGVEVVLDYGHNPAALQALTAAVMALDKRKTVFVMGLPGDRRDEDIYASVQATLPLGQFYILHDLEDLRGRKPNEIPQLMQQALPPGIPWRYACYQLDALQIAWRLVRPGDRLVIIADIPEKTFEALQKLGENHKDGDCASPILAKETQLSAAAGLAVH